MMPVRGGVYLAALTLAAAPQGSLTVPAQVQQVQGQPAPAISATFTYRQSDGGCDSVFTWDGGTWAQVSGSSSGRPAVCTATMTARPPTVAAGAGQHQVARSPVATSPVSDCGPVPIVVTAPPAGATPPPPRPTPSRTSTPAIGADTSSPDATPSSSSAPARASGAGQSGAGSAAAATSLFVVIDRKSVV